MHRLAFVLECDLARRRHEDTKLYVQDPILNQFGLRAFGVGIIVHTVISGYLEDGIRDLFIVNRHQDLTDTSEVVTTIVVAAGK